jgi:hypothetical protein
MERPTATTTPARSAVGTGGETRSAPRSASPVNFDSLNDQAVTVRERDSMQQVRIGIAQGYLAERLAASCLPEVPQRRHGAPQMCEPRDRLTLN